MRNMRRIVAALFLFGALAMTAAAQDKMGGSNMGMSQTKSLFDRLGGLPAITAVTDEFVARVVADKRINGKFARSSGPRVRLHLIEQLCVVTGGPCVYTGNNMKKTHKNMKVTEGEFNALVEDLVGALDKFSVPQAEKTELIGLLAPLKGQIVEVNSTATGTPLPDKFKPAPALPQSQLDAGPKTKMMKTK
ncbi:MAG TPA: group 1 truncated hemoglobin, partial [Pyrinomonadaceae bacterium]